MPKDVSERIIDWPYVSAGSRGGSVSIGGGGGGGGGATDLNALTDVTLSAPTNGQTLSYNSGSGQWVNAAPAAMVAHALSGSYHTGLLSWNLIDFSGSDLSDLATRQHGDLQGITPNQHHNQQHSIIGTDHTVVGAAFTVVGVNPANTVALLPTSSNPGATQSVLRTDAAGSIQLDTNLLYVDATNNRIGVNVIPGAGPAGGAAALDIRASATGDITQRIRQIVGQTQRLWRVEDTAGNELIIMDSVGNLQSGTPGFVSGLMGWQITPEGNAEFNNIWARGELHATVFVKDEVHATGGTFFVATAATLHDDATIDDSTVTIENFQVTHKPGASQVTDDLQIESTSSSFSGTTLQFQANIDFINVNDPPSGPAFYFQTGDTIRSKTEVPTGVTDFWLTVNSGTQMDGYARYSIMKRSGTNGVLPKGAALVSYGQVGDGRILMTSDLNYAPYLDVFTVGPNVWTGAAGSVIPRLRLGRLDGVGVPGVSGVEQYGMVAGTDLSNANDPYFIASNLQFKLYKINITLNNGTNDTALITQDGNLTLGSNIGVTAGKTFQVFATASGNFHSGDVLIGKEAGNFLKWDQNAGLLTINGSLQVGGVDAKTYIDQYRLEGVSGNFTVTGWQSLMWVSVVLRFADGPVTITNSATTPGLTGLTVRSWLYYDGTSVLKKSTALTEIGPSTVVVAVFDPGATSSDFGSVTVIGGSTYISGGNIITDSIKASNIQAGAVTASKINVDGDIDILSPGKLIVGVGGQIYSAGKTSAGNVTPGFFIGYDSGQYKVMIGDASTFLLWNGISLTMGVEQSLDMRNTNTGQLFNFTGLAGATALLSLPADGKLTLNRTFNAPLVEGTKVTVTNDTFVITLARTPASATATGIKGEICWDANYFYVCIATNAWKRIPMFTTGTYW